MNPNATTPPSPEEFQRTLGDFLKQQYGDKAVFVSMPPQPDTAQTDETGAAGESKPIQFEFNYKPKQIKAYLDRYVIQQDEAKKVLSIAVCDHYNHVKLVEAGKAEGEYQKQNVILIGPTGVGKTYLIKCIAQLIGVPFVKGDATKFSETGYVGGDVEDLVRELVQKADGNVKLAQYGIIYIDEVDKIATAPNLVGRDVSGRGVQSNLLKLMEETEVPLRSPADLTSQLQAALEFQRHGRIKNSPSTPATSCSSSAARSTNWTTSSAPGCARRRSASAPPSVARSRARSCSSASARRTSSSLASSRSSSAACPSASSAKS